MGAAARWSIGDQLASDLIGAAKAHAEAKVVLFLADAAHGDGSPHGMDAVQNGAFISGYLCVHSAYLQEKSSWRLRSQRRANAQRQP